MSEVNIITRKFRYFYDPATGTRLIKISGGDGYVSLTELEYEAAGVLNKPGGYDAFMSAAFKCGIEVPQDLPEFTVGYCDECRNDKVQPVRYFSYGQQYLCREHYEQAVKDEEVEQ